MVPNLLQLEFWSVQFLVICCVVKNVCCDFLSLPVALNLSLIATLISP